MSIVEIIFANICSVNKVTDDMNGKIIILENVYLSSDNLSCFSGFRMFQCTLVCKYFANVLNRFSRIF